MADAADEARLRPLLRIEIGEQCSGVVDDAGAGQAVHCGAEHCPHRVVATRDVETDRAEAVIHVRYQQGLLIA